MSSQGPDRARLDALFAEALDVPAPERDALLDRACAGEAALRADVEELLRLAALPDTGIGPAGLVEGPLLQALASEMEVPEGACIGPWRLVRELGRGGMGTVHLAERADGAFGLTAALKLVRSGAESDEAVVRFERERQILARLHHPNVARLLDGGRTEDGRPYLVMEYVEGRPLDAYCDERRLDVDGRLELFLKIGRAVQHAHASLVVHRDLKPSNIVVRGDGEVKLLDFGIAKLLAPDGEPGETVTRTMARVLTPEYASPEQVRGEPITTASDVYQLGLLLYELLTGQRAHRIDDASPTALHEAVCERQPLRPSALVTTAALAPAAAAARRTSPAALHRRLRGDLDNIVLMALRKEPERRYASVEQMLEDIERYRGGLPVRARRDTLAYRAHKFVSRHALGVAAAAAFALLLLGYAGTVTYQARQLARERDRAQTEARKAGRVRDFLVGLFRAADPNNTKGEQVTAAELVDAGTRVARSELASEPDVQSEMLGVLGSVLHQRAAYERAEPLLAEALAIQRRIHQGDHPDLVRALVRHAEILSERGDYARAEQTGREALEMSRRLFGARSAEAVDSLDTLSTALLLQGRYAESEAVVREALEIDLALPGPHDRLGDIQNGLGVVLAKQRKHEAAEAAYRAALAEYRKRLPPGHPDFAFILNNLAVTLANQERLAEAEPLHREALQTRRRIFGDEHPLVANSLHNLGGLQRRMGKLPESIASHREALAIRRKAYGPRHSNVALSLHGLGSALRDAGQPAEAEALYRQALPLFRETRHWGHSACALDLGLLLVQARRPGPAEAVLQEALDLRIAKDGPQSPAADEARLGLGLCRAAQGRRDEARDLIGPALANLRRAEGSETRLLAEGEAVLAQLQAAR